MLPLRVIYREQIHRYLFDIFLTQTSGKLRIFAWNKKKTTLYVIGLLRVSGGPEKKHALVSKRI